MTYKRQVQAFERDWHSLASLPDQPASPPSDRRGPSLPAMRPLCCSVNYHARRAWKRLSSPSAIILPPCYPTLAPFLVDGIIRVSVISSQIMSSVMLRRSEACRGRHRRRR